MSINPAQLPDDVQALKALVVKLEGDYERRLGEQVAAYHRELTRFREQLNLALARRFGVSSERIGDEQLRLFNEAESALAQAGAVDDSPVEVPAHTRKRSRRRPLPDSLPRVEVLHELAEAERVCPNDGAELKRIGEESSEQLDIVPAKVQVIRNIRAKYACPSCERHVVTAPMAAQPIPKSLASPGLLAHVTTSKYLDSLPLYRQERIFQRLGVDIPRATLASWMIRSGKLIQPLINLLRDELLGGDIIHCDETTVQVLGEEGRAAESKSYMWVQASANRERPVVLFDYDPSRGGAIPKRLLGEYSGYLITDGYEGYGPVCRANGITQVGCWAHARRKFDEVLKAAGINPRKTPKGKPPHFRQRSACGQLAKCDVPMSQSTGIGLPAAGSVMLAGGGSLLHGGVRDRVTNGGNAPATRRSRAGGRDARRAARLHPPIVQRPALERRIPPYEIVGPDEVELVHDAAMRIVEEIGVRFIDEESLGL